MHLSNANIALSAFWASFVNTLFLMNLHVTPFTMVQITFISSKILEVYLNGGPEMFLLIW